MQINNFKKPLYLLTFVVVIATSLSFSWDKKTTAKQPVAASIIQSSNSIDSLYESLHLEQAGLSRQAYDYAVAGQQKLMQEGKLKNDNILSIIDFSLPSKEKRLFILDVKQGTILFNTYVSHGRNSGILNAESFSNEPNSFKSSLGFYTTCDVYQGKHGCSLRLDGQEKGINDNALNRGIVMHAASYVDENLIKSQGYIGRSQGCPAVPEKLHKAIIETIKNGSCVFIYSNNKSYLASSSFKLAPQNVIASL